jgi:hypothetical protein
LGDFCDELLQEIFMEAGEDHEREAGPVFTMLLILMEKITLHFLC